MSSITTLNRALTMIGLSLPSFVLVAISFKTADFCIFSCDLVFSINILSVSEIPIWDLYCLLLTIASYSSATLIICPS